MQGKCGDMQTNIVKQMNQAERTLTNTAVLQFAAMKSAYDGCSAEVQLIITEMIKIVSDPDVSSSDKIHATEVIVEAMLPSLTTDVRELEQCHQMSEEGKKLEESLILEEVKFVERVQSLMDQKGLSQVELANRMGVTQPAVSNLLKRHGRPQRRTIARIAEALNVHPKELWPGLFE